MIATSRDPRIQLACQVLGEVQSVPDPQLPPRVVQVIDADGRHYFVKRHTDRDRYARELHAYRTWGEHLRGHAPHLIGRQDSSCTILLTALAGRRGDSTPPDSPDEELAHYEAGRVLGALHRATTMPRGGAVGASLAQKLRGWTELAFQAGLITRSEHSALSRHADILDGSRMDSATCHLDYQPRNWMVGDVFGVCDFEHMRRDARIRDFARLEFRRWQAAPRLRTAFFAGYGQRLNETEERLMDSFGAIEAATALVKGHNENDPTLLAHGRAVLARLA
ncbi:aminoglycoside phosphotransferase family protein [Streptomyces sp. A3M-1-3]|uniref:aminoglycoside phosphotransferase family protein n=1 Tax=Streptomyces sp. A3M-1-3 TaxID=2962044 RepID=UPI0020B73C5F|nr:aminoglycoside phosphotransferase family protein [Streptomyces sp. A3M-1-3]MCP3821837.1 aminoglycoside phosphotransferase family protein [Streptomyces sp. A3M-1-3]